MNFEVRGSSVIWSGQVLREGLKEKAEHAVREVKGVGKVVNKIEVLPPSRQDDVLRVNMYRAIYKASRGRRRRRQSAGTHHCEGWVGEPGRRGELGVRKSIAPASKTPLPALLGISAGRQSSECYCSCQSRGSAKANSSRWFNGGRRNT